MPDANRLTKTPEHMTPREQQTLDLVFKKNSGMLSQLVRYGADGFRVSLSGLYPMLYIESDGHTTIYRIKNDFTIEKLFS